MEILLLTAIATAAASNATFTTLPAESIEPACARYAPRAAKRYRERLEGFRPRERIEYLKRKRIRLIRGPSAIYAVEDTALLQAARSLKLDAFPGKVIEDRSKLSTKEFESFKASSPWFCGKGNGFLEDSTLDLVHALKERGEIQTSAVPGADLLWADYLSSSISSAMTIPDTEGNESRRLEQAAALSHSERARHLPGYLPARP